jgi:hypothetical protein
MILIWLAAVEAIAYTRDDCIRCHRDGSRESTLHLSIEALEGSVHGTKFSCRDCHTGVTGDDHTVMRGSGTVSCNACHDQENGHGKRAGIADRPWCASCHTKHDIRRKDDPGSSVHPTRLRRTCGQCHPVECGETGYLAWLPSVQINSHGKQDAGRRYERTNCLGCHQGQAAHGEDEPLDEQDCHKCHRQEDGRGELLGYIHARADFRKQPAVFAAAVAYQFALGALVVGGLRFLYRRFSRKSNGRK